MQLKDITVEVRDKSLARLGMIRPEELDLELSDLHNNVGTWKLKLAVEHPLAGALRQPGSGVVVTGSDGKETFSGPTIKQENAATADDPAGTITFEGVSDSVILADHLAFPEPSNVDPTKQTKAHDVRTGVTETLMHAYVNANIGPSAPAARRKANLVMGVNLGRGRSATKSARFKVLGNLLEELALVDDLGFRVIQRGSQLAFETYQVQDRSAEIRLDVRNNTLAGHRVAMSPPGATQVIVAGQDEGVDRQFRWLNTPESVAAENDWGRRIERFVDQRQTDKVEELDQAGMEVLTKEGFATLAVQAVPMEDSAMEFGRDWFLGDRVGVVVEGQELASTATGFVLKVSRDGFKVGALIGDPAGFDPQAALGNRVTNTEKRVDQLERNAENDDTTALDNRVTTLEKNPPVLLLNQADLGGITESSPVSVYPTGTSILSLGAGSGWFREYGTVVTHKHGANRCVQTFHDNNGRGMWTRSDHVDNPGWSQWSQISDEWVERATPLTNGQWYRIASFTGIQGQTVAKASAEFVITTDGSGSHQLLRLRATVAYNYARATLSVEECSGYNTTSQFTKARIVALSGTYGGHALEVYHANSPADGMYRMVVKHDDWHRPSNYPLNRWGSFGFGAVSATPAAPQTVLMQRGIGYTGEWIAPPLTGGWVWYQATYEPPGYKMDPGGVVRLKGLIKSGTVDDAAGSPVFTLPEGYRPGNRGLFSVNAGGNTMGRIDVLPDGRVAVAAGVNSYQSLDGITFLAIQ
ncbi:hypothetical protein [Micromonospora sp. GCM10011541]|uniref:Gp37-like protein n=1 Tax=Micromonospora sp. GCM10011541 TaxID=3317336 RepID=UPI00361D6C3F